MKGCNTLTGELLEGDAYRAQSINLVLSTPIGSLSFMRDFGSQLFKLIDEPITKKTQMLAFSYSSDALKRWLPELHLGKTVIFRNRNSLILEINHSKNVSQQIGIGI